MICGLTVSVHFSFVLKIMAEHNAFQVIIVAKIYCVRCVSHNSVGFFFTSNYHH